MRKREGIFQVAVLGLAGLILLASPVAAFSQGCALCYTQAASAGARMVQALRSGILVLIVPPMFLTAGITVLAYRKRNQFHDDGSKDESEL
jgi:hypothetical protein